jgi:hypothetical protein
VLVAKYGDHLPLYRQSQIFEREGIDLDRSTLADWVGKATALLEPLADAIGRHVLGGQAIFADDTPQAPGNGKTKTARIWTYVRDERPWLGPDPPAACYRFTVDRKGEHPANHLAGYKGWMQKLRPYLEHGCLEADNNGAERAWKPVALGRKNFLFVGSEGGGRSAAIAYTLIETAKLNGINPQAWLTDVLGRIADHKITRIDELLPWRYAASAA